MLDSNTILDGAESASLANPIHESPSRTDGILKADAYFPKPLLQRLFFEIREAAEPTCEKCNRRIKAEEFRFASATYYRKEDTWTVTHNSCEPDLLMPPYYVGLYQIATPRAALEMSIHLMGHRGFHEGWEAVIDKLYPSASKRRQPTDQRASQAN